MDTTEDNSTDVSVEKITQEVQKESAPSTSQNVKAVKKESKKPREGGRRRNLQNSKRGHRCVTHGCNRSFLTMQDLINHVSVHYKPIQSMQDKKFTCSVNGCAETVDSMQDLMMHLKVHYKPNRYFKCENCMQPFRTHRSLFKHLHVCTDNPSGSTPDSITAMLPAVDSKSAPAVASAKRRTSVIQCIKKIHNPSSAEDRPKSMAAASSTPLLGGKLPSMSNLITQFSNPFPMLDPSLFANRFPIPSRSSAASYQSYLQQSAYPLLQGTGSQKMRPFLGNAGMPVSNAMWKKNQGHTSNSRIVWEHTRGSYKCMQCSFTTAMRDQMDKHIEELHKTPPPTKPQEDLGDDDVNLLRFHSKLSSEIEPSLLPQV